MYPNYNSEPQNPPKELYNTNRHAVQPTSRPNTAAPKTRSSRKITNETYDNDSSKFSSRKRAVAGAVVTTCCPSAADQVEKNMPPSSANPCELFSIICNDTYGTDHAMPHISIETTKRQNGTAAGRKLDPRP